MIAVIAKIKVKEGKQDEFIQVFKDYLPAVKAEEGTLHYTLNRDRKDPNLFVFIERYTDEAAFQAHSSSPQFAELFAKAGPLMEGSLELTTLDEIASK